MLKHLSVCTLKMRLSFLKYSERQLTMDKPILLFDLDNTLLDFDIAETIALSKTLREFGLEPTEHILHRYHLINKRHWEMLEDGLISRAQVLVGRYEELFREFGIDQPGEAVAKRYEQLLSEGHHFLPGAEALLDELYGVYDMYIVSNGSAVVQEGRLKSSGIGRYFKDIFISELLGYDKPSISFFEACFSKIPGFDRKRTIIIGDSLTSDIRGGINAGIKTCWFNPKGLESRADIVPDYIVRSLDELPALFKSLA